MKGEGSTRSERILGRLGAASFLELWTYPSPHRNKKRHNKGDGKEICDLLVICGDDVVVFSDKEIGWSEGKPLPVAWGRWYREAVQGSVKQIRGAESHLRRKPHDVFLDKQCTVPLPIDLPPARRMRVHGVVIATGAEAACRRIAGSRGGRLRIDASVKGKAHLDPEIRPEAAFTIGDPDPDGSFVHVFDRPGMVAVLTTLDTISDFVRYLCKREAAIREGIVSSARGEDDMVAHYLWDVGEDGEHDFLRRDAKRGHFIPDGTADRLKMAPQFRSRVENDRVSYVWDGLIEIMTGHLLARTDIVVAGERLTISEAEEGLRLMALEPRFIRRALGSRIMDAISGLVRAGADRNAAIYLPQPTADNQTGYAVLAVANRDRHFASEETYREVRLGLAAVYARALLANNRHLTSVVAIGLDAPQEMTGKPGGSQDVAVHYQIEWTDELLAELRRLQEKLGILVGYRGGGRQVRTTEYDDEETLQQRRARERRERKAWPPK